MNDNYRKTQEVYEELEELARKRHYILVRHSSFNDSQSFSLTLEKVSWQCPLCLSTKKYVHLDDCPPAMASPPPLGVSVSDGIGTKDRMG